MHPVCYYRGKAKLAGLFGVPVVLLVLIAGYAGYEFADFNITPATVAVRDYTRSEGTHVSGYTRRPPCSVPHDQPYEYIRFTSFSAVLTGVYWAGRPVYRFVVTPPLLLLPPLAVALLPSPPIVIVEVVLRGLWC
ncbi:MAG: hypothetical protein WDO73_26820 [Ignavibacteriota bacterium]